MHGDPTWQALEHEEVVTQLKSEHAKQLSKQRLEFEEQVTALEAAAAARLRALREADEQHTRCAIGGGRNNATCIYTCASMQCALHAPFFCAPRVGNCFHQV